MGKSAKNLLAGGTMAFVLVSSLGFAAPAMAAHNTGNFSLVISGTQQANSGDVEKLNNGQNGTVYISSTTAGAVNM